MGGESSEEPCDEEGEMSPPEERQDYDMPPPEGESGEEPCDEEGKMPPPEERQDYDMPPPEGESGEEPCDEEGEMSPPEERQDYDMQLLEGESGEELCDEEGKMHLLRKDRTMICHHEKENLEKKITCHLQRKRCRVLFQNCKNQKLLSNSR